MPLLEGHHPSHDVIAEDSRPLFNQALARMAKGGSLVRRGEGSNLKKPAKTREELESAIRMEMEDICEWPTDLAISVVPMPKLMPPADVSDPCRR
jgi:hypothetical protein